MTISFYSTTDVYGNFSNFSRHGIEVDGQWWQTVEHYYQAQKFADVAYRDRIRMAHTPKQAAELGRDRAMPLRPDWELIKEQIMEQAVRTKFRTHKTLRQQLIETGDRPIVENAPGDYYWGCGKDGTGLNRLGEILMRVRAELQTEKS